MKLQVYFDYACPYCYEGHKNLLSLLPKYPALEVEWRPCEAHPRPEHAAMHSDLAIQGMFLIQELGGDLMRYHELVYAGKFDNGERIDDPETLTGYASRCGVDPDAFRQALAQNRYAVQVTEYNNDAWGAKGWEAVPSYLAGEHAVGSRGGVLVPLEELEALVQEACQAQ